MVKISENTGHPALPPLKTAPVIIEGKEYITYYDPLDFTEEDLAGKYGVTKLD